MYIVQVYMYMYVFSSTHNKWPTIAGFHDNKDCREDRVRLTGASSEVHCNTASPHRQRKTRQS